MSWRTQPCLWRAQTEISDAESRESLKERTLTPSTAWEIYLAACRLSAGSRIYQEENIRARTLGVSWVCNKVRTAPAPTKASALRDAHTRTRARVSCRAPCGAATYAPSFPARAWVRQQVGSDPAAFGQSGWAETAKSSPALAGNAPRLAREHWITQPSPSRDQREGSETGDRLVRVCTICWARCLQATGLGASGTNAGAPALPSLF